MVGEEQVADLLEPGDAEAPPPPPSTPAQARTSAADENCCRTPPIAFPVEPDAISAPLCSTPHPRAPSRPRWYAMQAPTEPEPATTIRATARAPFALPRSTCAEVCVRRGRPARRASRSTNFAAAWNGKRSSAARTGARSAPPGSLTAAATSSGNVEASAETAPTAPAASPRGGAPQGQRNVEPSIRYGANFPTACRTPSAP